jgi:hypothetical protein
VHRERSIGRGWEQTGSATAGAGDSAIASDANSPNSSLKAGAPRSTVGELGVIIPLSPLPLLRIAETIPPCVRRTIAGQRAGLSTKCVAHPSAVPGYREPSARRTMPSLWPLVP